MLCSKCARVLYVSKFIESTYSVATVLVHIYNDITRKKKETQKWICVSSQINYKRVEKI